MTKTNADYIDMAQRDYTQRLIDEIQPLTYWRHSSGRIYQVLMLANLPNDKRYPLTVVYRSMDNATWSRPASDWSRSMFKTPS